MIPFPQNSLAKSGFDVYRPDRHPGRTLNFKTPKRSACIVNRIAGKEMD
jgi:hypothetical protein